MEGFSAINGIAQDYFRSSCDILVGGYSSYIYEKWLQLICPRSKIPAICSIKFRPTCLRSFWNTAIWTSTKAFVTLPSYCILLSALFTYPIWTSTKAFITLLSYCSLLSALFTYPIWTSTKAFITLPSYCTPWPNKNASILFGIIY